MGYKTYSKVNVPEFSSAGDNGRYICNMCGKITTLHDSVSHKGHNLVCNSCVWGMRNILGIDDIIDKIQIVGAKEEVREGMEE